MVWWEAALPISFYKVREITARSVPQSHASYVRKSRLLGALNVLYLHEISKQ